MSHKCIYTLSNYGFIIRNDDKNSVHIEINSHTNIYLNKKNNFDR